MKRMRGAVSLPPQTQPCRKRAHPSATEPEGPAQEIVSFMIIGAIWSSRSINIGVVRGAADDIVQDSTDGIRLASCRVAIRRRLPGSVRGGRMWGRCPPKRSKPVFARMKSRLPHT